MPGVRLTPSGDGAEPATEVVVRGRGGEPAVPASVGRDLAVLLDESTRSRAERGRLLGRLAAAVARSCRGAGARALLSGRWLADALIDVAPRLPVRDAGTASAHHGGVVGDELAEALVAAAARSSAAVGAAGGALAAVQWAAPPSLLASPAKVAAETLAVAAIETKLVAELHHVYGVVPPGSPQQRGLAYVWAWTRRRGVDPLDPAGVALVVTGPVRRAVRNRLVARAGRNLTTMGPLLTGAALGSAANQRETARLGHAVMADLSARARRRPHPRP